VFEKLMVTRFRFLCKLSNYQTMKCSIEELGWDVYEIPPVLLD